MASVFRGAAITGALMSGGCSTTGGPETQDYASLSCEQLASLDRDGTTGERLQDQRLDGLTRNPDRAITLNTAIFKDDSRLAHKRRRNERALAVARRANGCAATAG